MSIVMIVCVEHGVHASARERRAMAVNGVPCSGNVLTLEMVHTVVVSPHQRHVITCACAPQGSAGIELYSRNRS